MNNWYTNYKGRYNIEDAWVGIDYGKHLYDPLGAELTYIHEITHYVIANSTDFGLATKDISNLLPKIDSLNFNEEKRIAMAVKNSQDQVQEGFATFVELNILRKRTNRPTALEWANNNFPPKYLDYFENLKPVFYFSETYRDHFLTKVPLLSMNIGFRKNAPSLKLLNNPERIESFLRHPNTNPNMRLTKIISLIEKKPYLVLKPIEELAELAGISYFEDATKGEVAVFLNYLLLMTGQEAKLTEDDIQDSSDKNHLLDAADEVIVGNLNLNLKETSEVLFDVKDFVYYADEVDTIFVNKHGEDWRHNDLLTSITGRNPEIGLIAISKFGEKYIYTTTMNESVSLLNNEFKDATLFVKWGGYDPITDRFTWSNEARAPEIVWYNRPKQLDLTISSLVENTDTTEFSYVYLSAGSNHPLQSLFVLIKDKKPLFVCNDFGNKNINNTIALMKQYDSKKLTKSDLVDYKDEINRTMNLVMNLERGIDWFENIQELSETV